MSRGLGDVYKRQKFNWISFLTQGGLVALGELGVMLVLGTLLYVVIVKRKLDQKLFIK